MRPSKQARRSVSLPTQVAKQVDSMAKRCRLSDNRVLAELINEGIEADKQKQKVLFELAERFRVPKDPDEVQWQGDEMGRFVFGERHNEVRPGRKVSNLKQLVAKITPENRHGETDWGADVGKEIIE